MRYLITGATGFLGHELTARLLRAGHDCVALVRPQTRGRRRLIALLQELGLDVHSCLHARQLSILEGALAALPRMEQRGRIDAVVHAAGCTGFEPTPSADPWVTNVEGTQSLLEAMSRWRIRDLHAISTAYVGGVDPKPLAEDGLATPRRFRNQYEASKFEAERACRRWAIGPGRTVTVYRPSIVVGDWTTGRTTSFSGFYVAARAAWLASEMSRRWPSAMSSDHPMRVRMNGCAGVNIVPIDYVSDMIVGAILDHGAHGSVYNLVHPQPPTNEFICTALRRMFDGGQVVQVSPDSPIDDPTELESWFDSAQSAIAPYLRFEATFCRAGAEQLEHRLGRYCPAYDAPAIERLLRHALAVNWGRSPVRKRRSGADCHDFFTRHLPERLRVSPDLRVWNVNVTVRFVIEDIVDGHWVCQFLGGHLVHVHRGRNGLKEDLTFRTSHATFRSVVENRLDPGAAFLSGCAELEGDHERALKLGPLLRAFTQVHPYPPGEVGAVCASRGAKE